MRERKRDWITGGAVWVFAIGVAIFIFALAFWWFTSNSDSAESRYGPLPSIKNGATLPAVYLPDEDRAWTATAADRNGECDGYLCVPAGVYQAQHADGDWCDWAYYQAGSEDYVEMILNPSAEGWKDADWTLITLQEGESLSYWPTKGATRYSKGLSSQGWEGDGQQRGCAEWVQVGTLDDAVPLPHPTTEECKQLVAEGEAAFTHVSDMVELVKADLEEMEAQFRAVLATEATKMPDSTILENTLVELMAATQEAQPKVHRADFCYSFLGDEQGASEMSDLAYGYIYAWADIKKQCPTDFAPAGVDCSRLGRG